MNKAWINTEYAHRFLELEKTHLQRALRQVAGPRVVVIGDVISAHQLAELDFPQVYLVKSNGDSPVNDQAAHHRIVADAAFLPIEPNSISTVILPHVLEQHALPHQVLREVHRILRPEGHLLLNGFNPLSLVGLQRFLYPPAAFGGHYYTVKRVKDWLQLLGLEVVSSAMYQYAPLVKSERATNAWNFINSVGDRRLPMTGGGYMISAKKRELGMRLVGPEKLSRATKRQPKLATAPARKTNIHSS